MELIINLQELFAAFPSISMGAVIATTCVILLSTLIWLMTLYNRRF